MRPAFLLFFIISGIFVFLTVHMVSATSFTVQTSLPKMFISSKIPSNAYTDTTHNFSIVPPDGWIIKSQSNMTGVPLVEFSNENSLSLAHLDTYFNRVEPIPPSIFALPNDQVLTGVINKLFNASKINLTQKDIQRFSDGFILEVVFTQKSSAQNGPIVDMLIFWLSDGRQYFLTLTSSHDGFNQNEFDFRNAASTFYVSPEDTSTVPEFGPITVMIFAVMISGALFLTKIKRI
jgi:predicted secreted protein with PEFG-CTERM motif